MACNNQSLKDINIQDFDWIISAIHFCGGYTNGCDIPVVSL